MTTENNTLTLAGLEIPDYYRNFYTKFLKFAFLMTIISLLMGVMYQESSKKLPISEVLPAGAHWEATIHLALTHGHLFLIGVLIPVAVCSMVLFSQILGAKPVSEKVLLWCRRIYVVSAAFAMGLMVYKGYHYNIVMRGGTTDFHVVDEMLFGGNHAIRAAVYGLTHTLMVGALYTLVVKLWRRLPKV